VLERFLLEVHRALSDITSGQKSLTTTREHHSLLNRLLLAASQTKCRQRIHVHGVYMLSSDPEMLHPREDYNYHFDSPQHLQHQDQPDLRNQQRIKEVFLLSSQKPLLERRIFNIQEKPRL